MKEQRSAFMNKYTHKITRALWLLFNLRCALGCLLLLWTGLLASCISTTSAYLDDLSVTYRIYEESGEIYESGGKEYEKLWANDYEGHPSLYFVKELTTYYTKLSPEKMVYFIGKDTETGLPTLFVEGEITDIRFLRKKGKKSKESFRPDLISEYDYPRIEKRRSLAGKILKPLIYVNIIAVDVPLTLFYVGGSMILAIPKNIIEAFSQNEEKKATSTSAEDTAPQDPSSSEDSPLSRKS